MSEEKIGRLRADAERARRFASVTSDRQTAANLLSYAADLETQAAKLEPLSSQAMEASGEPSSTQAMAALKSELPEEPQADDE